MTEALDPLPGLVAAACTAALLLHAAAVKLGDRAQWQQHLAAYGPPARLQGLLGWALPLAETALGLALLSPWRAEAAPAAAGLLLLYGLVMAWQRAQGLVLDCGCGGEPLDVSWALVARNALLAAVAALPAWPTLARPLGLADLSVAAAAALLGALLLAAFHQVLRQARPQQAGPFAGRPSQPA